LGSVKGGRKKDGYPQEGPKGKKCRIEGERVGRPVKR